LYILSHSRVFVKHFFLLFFGTALTLYHLRDALSRFFSVSLDGLTIIPQQYRLVNGFFQIFLSFFLFPPLMQISCPKCDHSMQNTVALPFFSAI
ncbi:MAG: hypothetical protein U0N62_01520, partial [Hydrogeniiclostridium sp.]